MQHEPNQLPFRKRAQHPAACLRRNDQMPARRYFQIRQTESFALQTNARVVFIDCRNLSNFDWLIHEWLRSSMRSSTPLSRLRAPIKPPKIAAFCRAIDNPSSPVFALLSSAARIPIRDGSGIESPLSTIVMTIPFKFASALALTLSPSGLREIENASAL